MQTTARIIEIFPSIQGEGIYLGKVHLFVRFWNCNLACHYCDTDYRGPYREYSPEALSDEVHTYLGREGPFHAVSLTGGEPLLWWRFLKGWLPGLKASGQTTYLETNGTLPDALRQILPWVDIIAMDIKLPTATADRAVWTEHEAFLRMGVEAQRDLFVKIVVTPQTDGLELGKAFDLMAKIDPSLPLVLQPVTPWGAVAQSPSAEQLAQWRGEALERLKDVRIIPQVHRWLGVP